jgi:predicted anti-sigma-YlaC factor YlaD
MNCPKIQSLLSAYADRELTGVEMFLIRQHVHDCDSCREHDAEVRRIKSILCSIEIAEPTPDFEARLISVVMGTKAHPAEEKRQRYAAGFAVTSLAAAAAICIVFTVREMPVAGPSAAATQVTPRKAAPPVGPTMAVAMQRDSAFINSADPLSGPTGAVAASYAAP